MRRETLLDQANLAFEVSTIEADQALSEALADPSQDVEKAREIHTAAYYARHAEYDRATRGQPVFLPHDFNSYP